MQNPFTVLSKPIQYFKTLGGGASVSTGVSSEHIGLIELKFERKIKASDVSQGKLVPIVLEEAKRRGGKRLTTLCITHESAEALAVVLKKALKDSRKRCFLQAMQGFVFFTILRPWGNVE